MEKQVYNLVKSPNDKRTYKALVLQNGIQVLLIHDSQITKSTCAISVGVGSLYQPDRSLGLAHFLEHMLFMGSQKYPSENQYSSFISLNAGFDNAYTTSQETNYYFQIATPKFVQCVDRLGQFFHAALLNPNSISKQSQAVHEQYMRWVNDDGCKKWGVLHDLGHGQYGRFSIGNLETLGHEYIRQDLVKFYETYYSSNIIKAVLSSNLSIQQLQNNISVLNKISNKNVKLPQLLPCYIKQQLGKHITIQSIKDQYNLQFIWVVGSLKHLYRKHINDYLNLLLGHQGQHSLLSILKQRSFASQLSSWDYNIYNATMIGIDIKLTQNGKNNVKEIYTIVTKFVNSLKAQKFRYDEVVQTARLKFEFKQKSQNTDYCCKLASSMHYIPLQNVLNYKSLADEFDQQKINSVLRELNPENLLLIESNNQPIQNCKFQKYLKTNYKVQALPELQQLNYNFQSIAKNPFLPVDLKLYTDIQYPRNIADNIVYLQDKKFKIVKGGIQLNIINQTNQLFKIIYSSWLQEMLKQYVYSATLLNLDITFTKDLQIKVFGYNDSVIKLIDIIGDNILPVHQKYEEGKNIFSIVLQKNIQTFSNVLFSSSDEIIETFLDLIMEGKSKLTLEELIAQLQAYQFDKFLQLAKNAWKQTTFEWIVVGNFLVEKVLKHVNKFEAHFNKNQQIKYYDIPCIKINKNISHQVQVQCQDLTTSCTVVYYQCGQYTLHRLVSMEILRLFIAEPYFDQLRTNKKLAYYLAARVEQRRGVLCFKFILQSSNTDPYSVGVLIKQFVSRHFKKFESIDESSVLVRLTQPHNSLSDLNTFICTQVCRRTYLFNKKQKEVIQEILNSITKQFLIQELKRILQYSLDIYVVANCHKQAYFKNDIQPKPQGLANIKQNSEYYEDFFSILRRKEL